MSLIRNNIAGLQAYTTEVEEGLRIDTEGMLVDLITVLKAAGQDNKLGFLSYVSQTWDEVKVEVLISEDKRN
jgi:hypothetical protein